MKARAQRADEVEHGDSARDADWPTVRLDEVTETSRWHAISRVPTTTAERFLGPRLKTLPVTGCGSARPKSISPRPRRKKPTPRSFLLERSWLPCMAPSGRPLLRRSARFPAIKPSSAASAALTCTQSICTTGSASHAVICSVAVEVGTQANLNAGIVNSLEIPLPPLPEQEQIATRLTEQLAAGERARAAALARLAAAEALPAAYLREVFEGSEASEWEKLPLLEIAVVEGGFAFKSNWFTSTGVRILRNANVHQGFIAWDDVVFVEESRAREYALLGLRIGDIVLSLDRPVVAGGLKAARLREADIPALLESARGSVQSEDRQDRC